MAEDVVSYDVPMRDYTLHVSYLGPRDQTALLLHGGGNTSSADIFPLRVDLARRGIGTLALDHRGHGKTGGNLGVHRVHAGLVVGRAAIRRSACTASARGIGRTSCLAFSATISISADIPECPAPSSITLSCS